MSSNKEINDNLTSDMLLNNNKKKNKYTKNLCVDELDIMNVDSDYSGSSSGGGNYYDFLDEFNGYKITRLEMIKFSIYSMINKLLNESPNIKVGLVTFNNNLWGLFRRKKIIKEVNDENKIKSFGDEYSFLISNPISKSSNFILSKLYSIKTIGCSALGPGIITSLSLLKNVKKGSRIFLCTDGLANEGVGSITKSKADENTIQKHKLFYEKIGEEAEKKGISINLITFKDEHSDFNENG